jgi:hypothetical protein
MNEKNSNVLYMAFVGAVLSAILAYWNATQVTDTAGILIYIGGGLTAIALALIVDHQTQQAQWMYSSLAAFVFGIVMLCISILITPGTSVFFYICVSFLLAAILSSIGLHFGMMPIIFPLAFIAGVFFSNHQIWMRLGFSARSLWGLAGLIFYTCLIFSFFAPTKAAQLTCRISAYASLVIAVLLTPLSILASSGENQIPFHYYVISIVSAIVIIVAARSWVEKVISRFNIRESAERTLVIRQAQKLLNNREANWETKFSRFYAKISDENKQYFLHPDLIIGNENAYVHLLKTPYSELARDLMKRLPVVYSSSNAKFKNSIVKIFAMGMETDNQQDWKPCLTQLIKLNHGAAFQMCMKRLKAGNILPYQYFLDTLEDEDYSGGMQFLAKKFPSLSDDLKRLVVIFYQSEIKNESQNRREITFSWLRSSHELGVSVGEELSFQFRRGVEENKLLLLENLAQIDGNLVIREAGWTVDTGEKTHVDALVSMGDEQQVVQNLLVFLKGLVGKKGLKERSAQFTTWLLELLSVNSTPRSAFLLLAISCLDTEKAFDYINQIRKRVEVQDLVNEVILRLNIFGELPQTIKVRFLHTLKDQFEVGPKTAQDILDGKTTLIEELYPFKIRPHEESRTFQIEELVNEPDERIAASHVSVWVFREHDHISQVVLAGHANMAICKEVSAKLASAQLRLGNESEKNFLLTGGAYLEATDKQRLSPLKISRQALVEKPPLEDFVQQLVLYEERTGMLKIHTVDRVTYEEAYQSLKAKIEEAAKGELPAIVKSDTVQTPGAPVYLPFFVLNQGALEPVEFQIDMHYFGEEFHDLLALHRDELYHEMIADAKRRKQIYEEWLQDDKLLLKSYTNKLINRLAEPLGIKDPSGLADKYSKHLLVEERPNPYLFPKNVRMEYCSKKLVGFIQQNSLGMYGNWRSQIQAALAEIQKPEVTISGQRDFVDASVISEKFEQTSLLEYVEIDLSELVKQDGFWIEYMDNILKDIDDSNPKRSELLDKQNLELFVDSFLRGWPSVFLPHKSLKDRYNSWCEKQREPIWQAIWKILMERGLQMTPLQEDNVVFRVTSTGQDKLSIMPHFLTTENSLLVLLDKRIGMTYYLHPWQHRKVETLQFASQEERRQIFNQSLEKARQLISIGDAAEAAKQFKLGIKLYPVTGTEALLENYWRETKRDTQDAFGDFSKLAVAIFNFWNSPQSHSATLSAFTHKYPDFLPDPYLYLGFYQHELADTYYQIFADRSANIQEYKDKYQSIVKGDFHIPGNLEKQIVEIIDKGLGQSRESFIINGFRSRKENLEYQNHILKAMEEVIDTESEKLIEIKSEIWKSIRSTPNANLKKALALDSADVNRALTSEEFSLSTNFMRYIAPLYQVLRGRTLLDIRNEMIGEVYSGKEDLFSKLKDRDFSQQRSILSPLINLMDRFIDAPYLEPDDKKLLEASREFIEQRREIDSITRESILPRYLDGLFSECLRRANKIYDTAAKSAHWITEVHSWLTDSYGIGHVYSLAINTLLSLDTSSLFNAFPNMNFELLNTQITKINKIKINPTAQTIEIITPDKKIVPVLHLEGLLEEDWAHISAELDNEDFVKKMNAAGLSSAYALLLMPISNPPRTKLWKQVIQELRPLLIQAFAHLAILPMEDKVLNREEAFIPFDTSEIVDAVEISKNSISTEILKKFSN